MKDYEQRERDLANMGHKDLIRFMRHAYNWLLDDGMSESELEGHGHINRPKGKVFVLLRDAA